MVARIRYAFVVALIVGCVGIVRPAQAVRTWIGGGINPNINEPSNWAGGAIPSLLNSATSNDVIFSGTATNNVTMINAYTYNPTFRNVTFDNSAGPFVFAKDPADPDPASGTIEYDFYFNFVGTGSNTINNSANAQTFNLEYLYFARNTINAAAGDFVFNALLNVGANTANTTPTLDGAHNFYINQGLIGNSGAALTKKGTGTAFIAESVPNSSYLDPINGTLAPGDRWGGVLNVNNGNVEITNSFSLGDVGSGATVTGYTEIRSAWASAFFGAQGFDDAARVTLTNNIDSGETMFVMARSTATNAQIANRSGTNTLSGTLIPETYLTNNTVSLQSDGEGVNDKLIVSGDVPQVNSNVTATLSLQGAGKGQVTGTISQPTTTPIFGIGALTNNVWNVEKNGGGTWELSGANTYTGSTTVNQGTLVIGSASSIANSSSINVVGGGLDVSGLASGGYTLTSGQALRGGGTVTGKITDSGSGNIIAPGNNGTGNLTISGGLSLTGGSTLQYDLTTDAGTNDRIVLGGNLSLAGSTAISLAGVGGNLTNGTYTLMTYTGALSGNQSNFAVDGAGTTRRTFSVSTATANQVKLTIGGSAANLTWVGGANANAWDVNSTINWTGAANNRFFNGDTVTFGTTGSTSPDINVIVPVAPAQLSFTNNSGHDYTFTGSDIAVAGNLTATGTGTNTLANANVSASSISVSAGSLSLSNSGTTSVTGNATVSGAASLSIASSGTATVTGNVTTSNSAALTLSGANGTTIGSLTAGSSGNVSVSSAALNVTGNFDVTGSGDVDISNTDFTVGGTFSVNGTGTSKTTIANSGTLTLPAAIALNSGTLALSRTDVLTKTITGAGTFQKEGPGTLTFGNAGNNSGFTGPIVVASGILKVTDGTGSSAGSVNINALGTGDAGTTVLPGATLDLNGTLFVNEVVTISGFGPTGTEGALADNRGNIGRRALVKGLILDGDASMHIASGGAPLISSGTSAGSSVDGQGYGFTVFGGGELSFEDLGETHFGDLTIDTSPVFFVGDTTLGSNAGAVHLKNTGKLAIAASLIVPAPIVTKNIFVDAGNGEIVSYISNTVINSEVTLSSELKLSVVSAIDATTFEINGKVTGDGSLAVHNRPVDAGLVATGVVTLTSDANDYTGTTTIGGGNSGYGETNVSAENDHVTLNVNGTHTSAGAYAVNMSGTLGGTGTITADVVVNSGGTLTPGVGGDIDTLIVGSAALLNTDAVTNGKLLIEYNGDIDTIDKLAVTGALDINNATIDFDNLGAGTLGGGAHIFASYGSLSGTFLDPANILDLPAGYAISYNYLGNNIALVPSSLAGDYNLDGKVDAADYVVWRKNPTVVGGGDPIGYNTWRANFGNPSGSGSGSGLGSDDGAAVPEPGTIVLAIVAAMGLAISGRKTRMNA